MHSCLNYSPRYLRLGEDRDYIGDEIGDNIGDEIGDDIIDEIGDNIRDGSGTKLVTTFGTRSRMSYAIPMSSLCGVSSAMLTALHKAYWLPCFIIIAGR